MGFGTLKYQISNYLDILIVNEHVPWMLEEVHQTIVVSLILLGPT